MAYAMPALPDELSRMGLPGLEPSIRQGREEHAQDRAVLERAARVETLHLRPDLDFWQLVAEDVHGDQRRATDGAERRVPVQEWLDALVPGHEALRLLQDPGVASHPTPSAPTDSILRHIHPLDSLEAEQKLDLVDGRLARHLPAGSCRGPSATFWLNETPWIVRPDKSTVTRSFG